MQFITKIFSRKLRQFEVLEQSIKKHSHTSLQEVDKARMKSRIMASLGVHELKEGFGFASLIEKVKLLAAEIKPTTYFRVLLKEKLSTLVEFHNRRPFTNIFARAFPRKVFATVAAVILLITIFFNFSVKIPVVEASFVTTLEELNGEVIVIREGQEITPQQGFLLKSDDIVKTGASSKAAIRFLDQSVSRLDENTEVKISRLFINPLNKTETAVELVLQQGRVWSRVINLIDDLSHFQVKAKNTVAVAKKKAAFDVSISAKGRAKVSAVQNRVDLLVATEKNVVETTLVKGFSAEMKTNVPVAPQILPEKSGSEQDEWISDNLAQDKAYIATIKQENQDNFRDQVNLLPDNPLYAVKQLSENTKIALTFDQVNKQKLILDSAGEKLASVEVLLIEQRDGDRAEALLFDFQSQFKSVADWVKIYEVDHPVEVLEIKAKLKEMLNAYQKQFALILPTDALYGVKQAVARTQVSVASNQAKKTEEKLSQASDKLLEAHDLVEQGNPAAARTQVKAYSKAISDVVSDVKKFGSDDKEKAVSAMLDTKSEDLMLLQAITKKPTAPLVLPEVEKAIGSSTSSVESEAISTEAKVTAAAEAEDNRELQKSLTEAKNEALTKMGEAVLDVQQNQPSAEVLKKVQTINEIDVNGKPVVNVELSKDRVTIRSDGSYISIDSSTPQILDSGTPESPQVQP